MKIKEFLKGLVEKLENAIKGLHGQSAEADFLRGFDIDELEELKALWTSALFDARENVLQAKSKEAKTEKNTTDEGDVKEQKRSTNNGIAKYTLEQYNAFGWASYNGVIDDYEREALLSNYADYKHNKFKFPKTKTGEVIIHSSKCPGVLLYVKGSIKCPEITKVARINANNDVGVIEKRLIEYEISEPRESRGIIENIFEEGILDIHRQSDFFTFQEYLIVEGKRKNSGNFSTYSSKKQNRTRSDNGDRKIYGNLSDEVKFQHRLTHEEDAEYLKLAENPQKNATKLREMVESVAKANGYTIKAYHATNADFNVFDIDKTADANYHGKGIYFTNSTRDVESNYENYEGPDPWNKVETRAYELAEEKFGISYEDTLTGDDEIIDKLNECYDEAIDEFKSTIRRVTAYLKFENPLVLKKGQSSKYEYDSTKNDGIIDEQVYDNIGHAGMDEDTVHYIVRNPKNIKSAELVTYDDAGNIIPLSERFNEKSDDIRYQKRGHWKPNMSRTDFKQIEMMAKSEVSSNDKYIDNITKWLYNKKNGKTYFAIYSTEDETSPTVLYASLNNKAVIECDFTKRILNLISSVGVTDDRQSEIGQSGTFGEILNRIGSTTDMYIVRGGESLGRQTDTEDVSIYSRTSKRRLSPALLNCLRDSFKRRERESVERIEDSLKYQDRTNQVSFEDLDIDYKKRTKFLKRMLKGSKKNSSCKAYVSVTKKQLKNPHFSSDEVGLHHEVISPHAVGFS